MDTSNDLIIAKTVAMTVLGICSFLMGTLPLKISKMMKIKAGDDDKNLLISLLLCFGGGVLLCTTFIHLQPEVRDGFVKLESHNKLPNFFNGIPTSELVFCFGFFFVYMMEELVHFCVDRNLQDDLLHRSLSVRRNNSVPAKDNNLSIPRVALSKTDDGGIAYIYSSNKELYNSQSTVGQGGHSHGHVSGAIKNSFGGLLTVVALSFHAVFEGLAVGLETSVQRVWYLFAAIATHKLVIAFCVGVELVSSKTKFSLVLSYIGTLAIVTPIGIGIGIALSASGSREEDVTAVVLQGMAAGTLLYVVFFEVLARERNNKHSGLWQLTAIITGFVLMFLLQIASGHSHSHSHSSDTNSTEAN